MRQQTGNQHTGNTGHNAHHGQATGDRGNNNSTAAANANRGPGTTGDTKHKEAPAKGRAAQDTQDRTDANRNTHTTKKDPPMGPARNK